jgi:hypothetical protein
MANAGSQCLSGRVQLSLEFSPLRAIPESQVEVIFRDAFGQGETVKGESKGQGGRKQGALRAEVIS